MKVLVVPDGRAYFAQGVEVDYGTQGNSVAEALDHFKYGLAKTIELNLTLFNKAFDEVPSDGLLAELRAEPGCREIEI